MNVIMNKIKSCLGESLTEALVAVLISALAMLMLATAVGSATNMVKTSNIKLAKYYDKNNELVSESGTSTSGTLELKDQASGTVLLSSSNVKLYENTEATFIGSDASNKKIYTYRLEASTP